MGSCFSFTASLLSPSILFRLLFRFWLRFNFVCIIDRENFRMGSRDLLHFCPQSDSRPSFTKVTVTSLHYRSNWPSVKIFGSKISQVRDSKDFPGFDSAFLCEHLYPQCLGSNVPNPPGSSPYCCASFSGRINSHFLYCIADVGVLLMSTPKSLSIETAPSPADVPFTRA